MMDVMTNHTVVLGKGGNITLDILEAYDSDSEECVLSMHDMSEHANVEEISVSLTIPEMIEILEYLLSKLKANPTL